MGVARSSYHVLGPRPVRLVRGAQLRYKPESTLRPAAVMKNFFRAVKYALRYRGRLIISFVCALIAASLWGLTFSAVYPILQLMEKKQSLQVWVDYRIAAIDKEIAARELEIDQKEAEKTAIEKLPPGKNRDDKLHKITEELDTKEGRLASVRSRQWRHQQLKYYVIRHLPNDLFETFAVLLRLVILSSAITGIFEFWQEYLVGVVPARTV